MTLLLALGASVAWGVGDFLGGLNVRRMPLLVLLAGVQASGAVAAVIAWVALAPALSADGAAWALGAGVWGALTLSAFYAALGAGPMSLVAPVTACGAVIPVAVALAGGASPGALGAAGMLLALCGAVLVSRAPTAEGERSGLSGRAIGLSVTAAGTLGVLVVLVQQGADSPGSSGLGVAVVARLVSCATIWLVVAVRRPPLRGLHAPWALVVAGGVLDTAANALFAVASRRGDDAVAAVLANLYPVTTVLMAWVLLRERLSPMQLAGVAGALGGVALIAGAS